MAVGNSETGGAIVGAPDSQAVSAGAIQGALDSKALRGGASFGAYDSKALLAGASYGAYDSKNLQGGAKMGSTISINVPGTTSAGGGLQMGFFFKLAYTANFGTPMVLAQLALPSNGHVTIALQSNANFYWAIVSTTGGSWSSTQQPATGISVNTWYYATYCLGTSGATMVHRLYVYQNGLGFYDGTALSAGTALASDTAVTATLGVGALTSGATTFAGWQNFPNQGGCEISKFWLRNGNPTGSAWGGPTGATALPVPATDGAITALSPLLFYDCRQTVGAAATLVDATVNANNAAAGPYGLQIGTDGPYG